MSDTQESTLPATDPNFAAEKIERNINGSTIPCTKITFGPKARVMVTRETTLGDEFDLIALAGDLANNDRWMLLAGLAYSIVELDGTPQLTPTKPGHIKTTLTKIGNDGLRAYVQAVTSLSKGESEIKELAKN
jgi:hypothetical protein